MPYWINGRDANNGELAERFYSEKDSEEAAREEATTQGIVVESIEFQPPEEILEDSNSILAPPHKDRPLTWPAYEFTHQQTEKFSDLAFYMNVYGTISIVLGLAMVVVTGSLIFGAVALSVGVLTCVAASSFCQIEKTSGRDMEYLIDAISTLRWAYSIQVWLIAIACGIALVVSVFGSRFAAM